MGQMSFYSADALPRAITDLEGVLCAGGGMSLFGRGTAARLTIVLGAPPPPPDEAPDEDLDDEPEPEPVESTPEPATPEPEAPTEEPPARAWEEGVDEIYDDDLPVRDDGAPSTPEPPPAAPGPAPSPVGVLGCSVGRTDPMTEWRAHALCCAFRGRGVPAEVERLPDGRPVVRSAFRADLLPLAEHWHTDPKHVPDPLQLDGPRLRLWVLAAGRWAGRAYTLGLDPLAPTTHEPLLTACQRAGLGATLAGDSGEPVVRIVGRARQRRLAELVGDRPRHLHDGVWPD
ncbi:hypothetical protein [Actinomycetospora sp. NBRC 106378]|uniref:hypothetical protein n=1 Tax=Actinomycetospora sp. NBRC 106378 TaxID=3032208 RepID=UPI00249F9EFA|nr:hypothetical protein [Actinomycetospora sp. NBRC 106378]GLZ52920.1 hypothetical protein Acsp07_25370 [Actinomycetospora sp. NBRC 106378]